MTAFTCSGLLSWLSSKESVYSAGNLGLIPGLERSPGEGTGYPLQYSLASLVAQTVKNLPAVPEIWVWSLGWKDPLEEDMATHSIVFTWKIAMDRGAWRATVHGATKSRTQLSGFHFHFFHFQVWYRTNDKASQGLHAIAQTILLFPWQLSEDFMSSR